MNLLPVAAAVAFVAGATVTHWYHDARYSDLQRRHAEDKAAAITRASEQARALAEQDGALLLEVSAAGQRDRQTFTQIKKEIRYVEVPGDCTVAPDHLRLWNAANRAAGGAAAAADTGRVPDTLH